MFVETWWVSAAFSSSIVHRDRPTPEIALGESIHNRAPGTKRPLKVASRRGSAGRGHRTVLPCHTTGPRPCRAFEALLDQLGREFPAHEFNASFEHLDVDKDENIPFGEFLASYNM